MQFLVNPENDIVKQYYEHHGTFHVGDSGLDLYITKDIAIDSYETKLVDLNIRCRLVKKRSWYDYFFGNGKKMYSSYMVVPRSSIYKTPLRLANSIGLIDAMYEGTIKIALHNTAFEKYELKAGTRLVQLITPTLEEFNFKIVNDHEYYSNSNSTRKEGGFGSTGV